MILRIFFILFIAHNKAVLCQDAEGEKAHFQVHNKQQGTLEIHATKAQASISATADSVQMVVDPGQEKIPEEDIQAQTVKYNTYSVIDPSNSVKKSKIFQRKQSKIQKRFRSEGSHIQKKKSKEQDDNIFQTVGRKRHFSRIQSHHHDVTASKKSNVDKEMSVHGQSGRLHVHTDHNLTAVHSNSGKLEIYIKNPDHHFEEDEKEHSKVRVDVFAEESYSKKNKLQKDPQKQLHIIDVTGVKKSELLNKNILKFTKLASKRNRERSKRHHRLCVVPPCSNQS